MIVKMKKGYDMVGHIIDFECGELDYNDVFYLFCHLRLTGALVSLQGTYQRTYMDLKEGGALDEDDLVACEVDFGEGRIYWDRCKM